MSGIKILALSGSLKSTSANTNILRFMADLMPEIEFTIYDGLESIPAFNPEKEEGTAAVTAFKQAIKAADGVIISTPEYAFGLPGVLKNALDWTVASGELNEKPVIAISASPLYSGGNNALSSLLLTLGALGTKMTEQSSLSIPDILNKIDTNKEIKHERTTAQLKALVEGLIKTIQEKSK